MGKYPLKPPIMRKRNYGRNSCNVLLCHTVFGLPQVSADTATLLLMVYASILDPKNSGDNRKIDVVYLTCMLIQVGRGGRGGGRVTCPFNTGIFTCRVRWFSQSHESGRVKPGGVQNLTGRVGSGRAGSDHLTRPDPRGMT